MKNLDPAIQKQLEFVEWLKEKGMYNPMESAQTMQKLHAVWEAAQLELRPAEVDLIRQWFDAAQDLNEDYLKPDDYALARKIYKRLGRRVPSSITGELTELTHGKGVDNG